MLAHERLEQLQGRLQLDTFDAAAAELTRIAKEGGWDVGPGDPVFDEVVADIAADQAMVGDLRRAWRLLKARVRDPQTKARLGALDERIALGTATDGEISAAVFAYPDTSYLVLVDHGLMLCTWLAAQLAAVLAPASAGQAPADSGVEVEDAVAAMRLAIVRPAVGARAGFLPALLLPKANFHLAASLAREMDIFLLAHEVAHVMLGHFQDGRQAAGAVAGSVMADRGIEDEHAADTVALTLLLDDIDSGDTGPEHLPLRLAGVSLTLALIESYERTSFVIQPTSHPPAHERFAHLRRQALQPWFGDDLEALLAPLRRFADALERPPTEDLFHAVGRVDRGLSGFLDRPLWRTSDWSEFAQLGSFVVPRPERARQALGARYPRDDAGDAALQMLLSDLVEDPKTQALIEQASQGEVVRRLALLDHTAALLTDRGLEKLPVWAVNGLLVEALRELATQAG
jgi:hypothetical protein